MKRPLEEDAAKWLAAGGDPFGYTPHIRYQCIHIQSCLSHVANRLIQTVRRAYPDDNTQSKAA